MANEKVSVPSIAWPPKDYRLFDDKTERLALINPDDAGLEEFDGVVFDRIYRPGSVSSVTEVLSRQAIIFDLMNVGEEILERGQYSGFDPLPFCYLTSDAYLSGTARRDCWVRLEGVVEMLRKCSSPQARTLLAFLESGLPLEQAERAAAETLQPYLENMFYARGVLRVEFDISGFSCLVFSDCDRDLLYGYRRISPKMDEFLREREKERVRKEEEEAEPTP